MAIFAFAAPTLSRHPLWMPKKVHQLIARFSPWVLLFCVVPSCKQESSRASHSTDSTAPASSVTVSNDDWLLGKAPETQARMIAKQFRGFDVAMMEIAYRYNELFWALEDDNDAYANYQLQKIETVIDTASIRRPKREASAKMIREPIRQLQRALQHPRSKESIQKAFQTVTTMCNACHIAEGVPFMHVKAPTLRTSVIHQAPKPSE